MKASGFYRRTDHVRAALGRRRHACGGRVSAVASERSELLAVNCTDPLKINLSQAFAIVGS
jgi:hypothetical protein